MTKLSSTLRPDLLVAHQYLNKIAPQGDLLHETCLHNARCGRAHLSTLPDRPSSRVFQRRIGNKVGASAPTDTVTKRRLRRSHIAGGGQIDDAPTIPDPTRHIGYLEKNRTERQAAR